MIRFASLGSGSGGNALVVEADDTRVLLDCGFGPKELERRLQRLGLSPDDLAGVVVTHEHDDHASGALQVAARFDMPLWLTYGTYRAMTEAGEPAKSRRAAKVELIDGHSPFLVGDLEIFPFPVPHDAREPVQYVFGDGNLRLGVLTDIGAPTRHVERMLSGCEALVLECNHDAEMLAHGPYPRWLKERIGGPFGHLANSQSAALLASLDCSRLSHLIAAHLSASNNTAGLAQAALAEVLGCAPEWISVAAQDGGFDWREIR